tara:strand:+ start:125 stop:829 length:705 start_codon:yes stop_codon:yes gene_type:complete
MNPIIRSYLFLFFAISVVSTKNFYFLLFHLFLTLLFFLINRIELYQLIKKIWSMLALSASVFFIISLIISSNSINLIYQNVLSATLRIFILISLMNIYIMKSKTDNLIAAIRSLLYRYSIKSLSFDKNILFFDLTIRLYPDMQNQWRNLLRGQNALSNKSKLNLFKKKSNIAKYISDFLLLNLWRTEKLSECMEMRGYGQKFPRSIYPYYSIKFKEYILIIVVLFLLFCFHFAV